MHSLLFLAKPKYKAYQKIIEPHTIPLRLRVTYGIVLNYHPEIHGFIIHFPHCNRLLRWASTVFISHKNPTYFVGSVGHHQGGGSKEGPPVQKWMPYKSRRRRPEDAVDRWQGAKNCEKDGIWIYQTWLEHLSFGLMIFKFKAVANNSSFG